MSERLAELKAYADEQGIKYHPAIGEDALEQKIQDWQEEQDVAKLATKQQETEKEKPSTPKSNRRKMKDEQLKLVRVRVTCMNPNKKEWEGEIFTASNALVGTVKKYVPFNLDDAWHIPQIILNVMKEREFQHFFQKKDERGNRVTEGRNVKEFAIEVLPPLTEEELKELARVQAARKGQ